MKVALTFARMNPMTIGHMKVVNTLSNIDADDRFIYLSHTQDKDKNPLPYLSKISYVKFFTRNTNVEVVNSNAKTIIEALKELKDYDDVVLVVGGDRVNEFKNLILSYNGLPNKQGEIPYNFKSIEFVNAGERVGDDEASNASATKARNYVRENDYEGFKRIIPTKDESILKELWNDLKQYMRLKEKKDSYIHSMKIKGEDILFNPNLLTKDRKVNVGDNIKIFGITHNYEKPSFYVKEKGEVVKIKDDSIFVEMDGKVYKFKFNGEIYSHKDVFFLGR